MIGFVGSAKEGILHISYALISLPILSVVEFFCREDNLLAVWLEVLDIYIKRIL